jgi:murein DD-endopeptidase MepM/ murein hydrolase activator NlpD
MYEDGQISTIEIAAKSNSFSEYVNRSEYMEQMQIKVKDSANKVVALKQQLEVKRNELAASQKELKESQSDLIDQREGVESQKNIRASLLTKTKNQEAYYQKDLKATQKAREIAWAKYWAEQQGPGDAGGGYQGGSGNGYLTWPSSGSLTQGYGWTQYAQAGWYNGNIHNGIDTSCGWPCNIKAAASGRVIKKSSGGGWGNYVLIEHPNGLVTLYAHLSTVYVYTGQVVAKGQRIGKEGSTGFSTGSHLHFSVYSDITLYRSGSFSYGTTVNPFSFL